MIGEEPQGYHKNQVESEFMNDHTTDVEEVFFAGTNCGVFQWFVH